jgi:hypothetical protein
MPSAEGVDAMGVCGVWKLAVLLMLGSVGVAMAEEQVDTEARVGRFPVSVELVPGLGFGGGQRTHFGYGLAIGRSAEIQGLALASAISLVDGPLQGLQLSGAMGVSGMVTGAQVSGAISVSRGPTLGLQVAGAVNHTTSTLRGLQLAGAVNHVGGSEDVEMATIGWQIAGAINRTEGLRGMQIAGAVNVAGPVQGVQLSVLNVGGDVDGAQIGVFNVARSVRGLQLGVVNVADSLDGLPLGLVSVVGDGQFHLQAWASDLVPTNVSLKYGSRHVYTLLTIGRELQRPQDAQRWAIGAGLGGHLPLGRFYLEVDASAYNVRRRIIETSDDAVLAQARLVGGVKLLPRLSLFAGVTANVLTDWGERTWDEQLGLGPRLELGGSGARVALWPGLVGGVQL